MRVRGEEESGGPSPSSIRITTSTGVVAGCASLGEAVLAGDDGLELLRREASRRGADVVVLTSLAGREIQGRLYRCGGAGPSSVAPSPMPPEAGRSLPSLPSPAPTPTRAAVSLPAPVPVPSRASPAATPSSSAARGSAGDRQRRAQEEFLELQAAVRVTDDPKLVEGCEKRGAGHAEGAEALSSLRGDAVGQLANVILVRTTAGETTADFFRCPARTLQAIPLALLPAPPPAPPPAPR